MNLKPEFTYFIKYLNLILLVLLAPLLSGQQTGSAPVIAWENPLKVNSESNSQVFTLKARIISPYDLQTVRIYINDNQIHSDNQDLLIRTDSINYSLEKSILLEPGKNSIYILAANVKEVVRSARRVINYPVGSKPVINIISPSDIDTVDVSGNILVKAEIKSYSELQTCRLYQNGSVIFDGTAAMPEHVDSITYTYEKRLKLQNGLNNIYLEARNTEGTGSSEKRNINYRFVPIIKWILPSSVNSDINSGFINIKAEIKSSFELQSAMININGNILANKNGEITRINDETYLLERTIQLSGGKNNVFITAGSAKGVTHSAPRVIKCLIGSVPVITLFSPSGTDTLNFSGNLPVKAEIVSQIGLQTIRVLHNSKVIEGEPLIKTVQKDSITYIIETLVPLLVGSNTIYIEARNAIGTSISEKHNTIWQLEPFIVWVSPSSGYSSSKSGMLDIKASIKSKFDLQNVRINLNDFILSDAKGEITRLDNDTYTFEKAIQLEPGENKIYLDAGNAKGLGYSSIVNVSYIPGFISEIKWVLPIDVSSNVNTPQFPVSANIKTESEIKNTQLLLNGTVYISGDRSKTTQKDKSEYIYEDLLTLKPGINIVELSAITDEGTISSEKRTITYTAPVLPSLAWKYPLSDQTEVNQASMDIRMNIRSAQELNNIKVYLNGQVLDKTFLTDNVKKENEDFVLGSTLTLQPGDNTIYVSAGNIAGNATSEMRYVRYVVSSMPAIAWGNPDISVSSVSTSTITITANITSTTEINDLQVYHNGKALSGTPAINMIDNQQGVYRVEETINLDNGENRIYIEAGNIAGKSTSEIRTVNFEAAIAPLLTWISPSRQYTDINLNSAKIRASVKSADALVSFLIYVNGVASEEISRIIPSGSQGEYALEKTIDLQPGENIIYILATNSTGATRSEDRYLTNPPANPPVISWTIPTVPNSIVNSEIVEIEACIKSSTDLKTMQIFVNGIQQVSEMVFHEPLPGECNYRISKQILLKQGDNSVRINATNIASSEWSDVRQIRYETISIIEKRLALVIGNADYGSSNVLKNPVNDANLIEGTLKTLGFEVVKCLNATKSEMELALRDFSKKLADYNVALFYYAGHGIQINGENYLIPTDAMLEEQSDCQWEALQVNTVVRQFEQVPENINIIILDACRNNPFRSWSRGGEQGFRALNAVSGTIVSFATSENSTAADGTGSNGTYTEELVRQMVIPQSISSVFINTRKEVMRRTNSTQRPQEWNMLTGDFYFKK